MIYTNLDTNNMYNEIKKHLKNINNLDYIIDYINTQYLYNLINNKEKIDLFKEFVLNNKKEV